MFFFFQAEDGIRDPLVTGVQTCALPICGTHDALGPVPDRAGRGRARAVGGAPSRGDRAISKHVGPAARRQGPNRMTGPAAAAPESASTREKILGAAYRTLVEVGYTQISMRKIAEGAGVNQSLLHYYYGSKENLMLEVLDFVNERLL